MTLSGSLERKWDLRIGRLEAILWIALSLALAFSTYVIGFSVGRSLHTEQTNPLITIEGVLQKVTLRKERTGFTVMRILPNDEQMPITAVGVYPEARENWNVRVIGSFVENKRFGRQFVIQAMDELHPVTPNASGENASKSKINVSQEPTRVPNATPTPATQEVSPEHPNLK